MQIRNDEEVLISSDILEQLHGPWRYSFRICRGGKQTPSLWPQLDFPSCLVQYGPNEPQWFRCLWLFRFQAVSGSFVTPWAVPPGSSVYGIFWARTQECFVISSSWGPGPGLDLFPALAAVLFHHWAIWGAGAPTKLLYRWSPRLALSLRRQCHIPAYRNAGPTASDALGRTGPSNVYVDSLAGDVKAPWRLRSTRAEQWFINCLSLGFLSLTFYEQNIKYRSSEVTYILFLFG